MSQTFETILEFGAFILLCGLAAMLPWNKFGWPHLDNFLHRLGSNEPVKITLEEIIAHDARKRARAKTIAEAKKIFGIPLAVLVVILFFYLRYAINDEEKENNRRESLERRVSQLDCLAIALRKGDDRLMCEVDRDSAAAELKCMTEGGKSCFGLFIDYLPDPHVTIEGKRRQLACIANAPIFGRDIICDEFRREALEASNCLVSKNGGGLCKNPGPEIDWLVNLGGFTSIQWSCLEGTPIFSIVSYCNDFLEHTSLEYQTELKGLMKVNIPDWELRFWKETYAPNEDASEEAVCYGDWRRNTQGSRCTKYLSSIDRDYAMELTKLRSNWNRSLKSPERQDEETPTGKP
jgi:hypothetical protein